MPGETVTINIDGRTYEVLDSISNITLADSFVKNKLGSGHGEAKLYVGNESQRLFDFFDDFNRCCFFVKADFVKFLLDAKDEYMNPQQDYVLLSGMPHKYNMLEQKLSMYENGKLYFYIYRKDVEPPRVYIQSNNEYYEFMRDVALPNISYLSVMKVKDSTGNILYYFRIFVDYKSDIVKYISPKESEAEDRINGSSTITTARKESLIQARIGQGLYRRKLLEECPFCPISLINDERLLIASHIKPWVDSDDNEKIDPKNGLALCPNFDAMFDKGFMTFDPDKKLIVSPWISPMNQKRLGIYTGLRISKLPLDAERELYMQYHREYVYKG